MSQFLIFNFFGIALSIVLIYASHRMMTADNAEAKMSASLAFLLVLSAFIVYWIGWFGWVAYKAFSS